MSNLSNEECLHKYKYKICNTDIEIEYFIDYFDFAGHKLYFVWTPRLRPDTMIPKVEFSIETHQICGWCKRDEFLKDVLFQINYINNNLKTTKIESLIEAMFQACKNHISRYGRLIDIDMLSYIDAMMHVYRGLNPNEFFDANKKDHFYNISISRILSELKPYIYVSRYPYPPTKMN